MSSAVAVRPSLAKKSTHTISTVSKIFLAFVFVECAALAGVCIWMLCDVANTYSRLNLIVVLGTSAMLAFFAVDSVMTENKFQLLAFFALSGLLTARVIWGYFNPTDGHRDAQVATLYLVGLISSCVFEAVFILLGFCITDSVWDSFGYYMYKNVSALPKDQEMYSTYQKFITLLFLDLSCSLVWIVLAFADLDALSLSLNAAAIAVSLLWALLGWAAAMREQLSLMRAFWVLAVVWPVYVGYQAYQIAVDPNNWNTKGFNLGGAGASSIATRVALLYFSRCVAANFGEGLKAKVFDKQWSSVVNYGGSSDALIQNEHGAASKTYV